MADIGGFLKKMFPFISMAASLGGPPGVLAARVLGAALNSSVKPTTDGISQALTQAAASPDQLLAAQKAEQEFQAQMQQMGFQHVEDLEKIAADDRASARVREEQVRDWMPKILGLIVIGLFVWVVCFVLMGKAKADTVIAGTLLGYASAKAELVLTYYFGSSAGSDRQTELLAQAQPIENKSK